jgi:hypothetical protein
MPDTIKIIDTIDSESYNNFGQYLSMESLNLIESTLKDFIRKEKELSFKEGRASMVEKVIEKVSGMAIYGKQEQNKIIEDIINKIQDNE